MGEIGGKISGGDAARAKKRGCANISCRKLMFLGWLMLYTVKNCELMIKMCINLLKSIP